MCQKYDSNTLNEASGLLNCLEFLYNEMQYSCIDPVEITDNIATSETIIKNIRKQAICVMTIMANCRK
jgi:hypothetical protein